MIKVGGRSYSNGITFYSEKYSSGFECFEDGTAKIFLAKNKIKSNSIILDIIDKIPFLRVLSMIIKNMPAIIVLFAMLFYVDFHTEKPSELCEVVVSVALILILYLMIQMFKKPRETWKFHGAEHKIINAYRDGKDINFKNCMEANRVSADCGSMFVTFMVCIQIVLKICIIILNLKIHNSIILLFTWSITYELFLLREKNIPLIRDLKNIGYTLQEEIITKEPEENQMLFAMEAFKILLKAENGEYDERKIRLLLKNPKKVEIVYDDSI